MYRLHMVFMFCTLIVLPLFYCHGNDVLLGIGYLVSLLVRVKTRLAKVLHGKKISYALSRPPHILLCKSTWDCLVCVFNEGQ